MKKNWKNNCKTLVLGVVALFFVMTLSLDGQAQNRRIEFKKGEWKQQLKRAKKEKKLIFLDCNTKWCGFCKALDQYVFTMDKVADFYNQNFINVQMDMEEGVGPELVKKYGLSAYPSLLFIDETGEVVHAKVGYVTPEESIALGSRAMEPENNLAGLQAKYAAGDRTLAVLKEYFRVLTQARRGGLHMKIMEDDVLSLDDQQFYTTDVWELIVENTGIALPTIMKRVLPNRERFDQLVGAEKVNQVLDKVFTDKGKNLILDSGRKNFKLDECRKIREFVQVQEALPFAAEYVAAMYAAEYLNLREHAKVIEVLNDVLTYNFCRVETLDNLLNFSLRCMTDCEDVSVKQKGVDILDSLRQGLVREKKKPMYEATRNMLLDLKKD